MALSLFDDKSKQPKEQMLAKALGKQYQLWTDIAEYVVEKYPKAIEEWKYPGVKYGWSFRLKDKKRNIIYMMPGDGCIIVAFVFGDKGVEAVQDSSLPQSIKDELRNAQKYPEGRVLRLQVRNKTDALRNSFRISRTKSRKSFRFHGVANIKILVDIKLAN